MASRRTVFKQLEQLVCPRVSFRPIDSSGYNGMNSGSIWQPPTNNDAPMSPFTAMRSRAWIIDSASTIAAPRSPNERIQSPISRPAELRVVRKPPSTTVPSGLLDILRSYHAHAGRVAWSILGMQ